MPRVMSLSDRDLFLQSLAVARNLSIDCESREPHDSELRKVCERLNLAIDDVVSELVGDAAYLHIKEVRA